jgi:hypothetical protein
MPLIADWKTHPPGKILLVGNFACTDHEFHRTLRAFILFNKHALSAASKYPKGQQKSKDHKGGNFILLGARIDYVLDEGGKVRSRLTKRQRWMKVEDLL